MSVASSFKEHMKEDNAIIYLCTKTQKSKLPVS